MIPVSRPVFGSDEERFVFDALRRGELSGTFGAYIERFEEEFARFCGTKFAVACSSGSTALHLACAALGIGSGDEVLVSASTNIASANAVVLCGGVVVPVDCDPETWQMDPRALDGLVTSRTKAIMPVHLFGHPVDMGAVGGFAKSHGLNVIEDCAEAHGAEYRGRRVGSFGDVGCFSFYANKMITTGEGGMCTTNSAELAERLRYLRNLAFGKPRFLHAEVGFNYRMTNLQAAVGCGQMALLESNIERKRAIAATYTNLLQEFRGLTLPIEAPWAKNVYWMYALTVDSSFPVSRDSVMAHLSAHGIETRTMFCPMNLQPALRPHMRSVVTTCPVAERLWRDGLYLPSAPDMNPGEVLEVVTRVVESAAMAVSV